MSCLCLDKVKSYYHNYADKLTECFSKWHATLSKNTLAASMHMCDVLFPTCNFSYYSNRYQGVHSISTLLGKNKIYMTIIPLVHLSDNSCYVTCACIKNTVNGDTEAVAIFPIK